MKTVCLKFTASIFFVIAFLCTSNEAFSAVHFMAKSESVTAAPSTKPCPIQGYKETVKSCTSQGKIVDLTSKCPTDGNYVKSCVCATTYKYDATTCKDNKTPSGNSCEGKFDLVHVTLLSTNTPQATAQTIRAQQEKLVLKVA